jgi:cytochrome b561
MKQVTRYHPLLVILHWLLAILILAALAIGFFLLAGTPNSDPQKIAILRIHMAGGMLILAVMILRFVVRLCTAKPAVASIGDARLDRLAPLAHYGFYVVILLTVGTGYATGLLAGLPAVVFARSGDPLPAHFGIFPTFVAHSWLAIVLAVLIGLHVLAALYHQFVRKECLFRRMGFGRRMVP